MEKAPSFRPLPFVNMYFIKIFTPFLFALRKRIAVILLWKKLWTEVNLNHFWKTKRSNFMLTKTWVRITEGYTDRMWNQNENVRTLLFELLEEIWFLPAEKVDKYLEVVCFHVYSLYSLHQFIINCKLL